jgi:hypothetical protein
MGMAFFFPTWKIIDIAGRLDLEEFCFALLCF